MSSSDGPLSPTDGRPGTTILFIIGAPGSGKSTQAMRIARCADAVVRISPGDILRETKTTQTLIGKFISNNWNHKNLVPIVNELMLHNISPVINAGNHVVVEGFPRTREECEHIAKIANGVPIFVIELLVSSNVIDERTAQRSGRESDDGADALKIRMASFARNMVSVREFLQHRGIYAAFEAIGTEDEVNTRLHEILHSVRWRRQPIPQTDIVSSFEQLTQCDAIETAETMQLSLELAESTRMWNQFCGTHPISLTRAHISNIMSHAYYISIKLDGERFLCVIRNAQMFFISRAMQVFRGPAHTALAQFNNTLLDGELCDKIRFAIFDVLCVSGHNVMHAPLGDRLESIRPLFNAMLDSPFQFEMQQFMPMSDLHGALARNAASERFDGIIFTPAKLPYRLGIDRNLFKYKAADRNTVDLLVGSGCNLFCGGGKASGPMKPMGSLSFAPAWIRDGMLVECLLTRLGQSAADHVWKPIKIRTDKTTPNVEWVVERIVQSIRDNIGPSELLALLARAAISKPSGGRSGSRPR